ncbi:MAG: hypothetical protein K0B00_10415 [Rhodobacteraceae bacterium]|nr:hypothetical protein [Paracoccaceae bacterium]
MTGCTRNCWIAGAVAGVAVAAFLVMVSHMALVASVFLGLLTGGLMGAFLVWAFCAAAPAEAVPAVDASPEIAPPSAAAPVPVVSAPEPAALPEPAHPVASALPEAIADAAAPDADDAARALRRAARQARRKAAAAASAATPEAQAEPAQAGDKPRRTKAEREARAARRAARAARAAAAARADGEPELLAEPRGGVADDLKAIKGVGPKFEKLLNANGIWHYDQIASWGPKDIATVDAKLEGFSGRIARDGWVEQAKTLAAGGATEFSKRVAEGDVYKGTE